MTQVYRTFAVACRASCLICWADNVYAHIMTVGGFNRSPVELIDGVPVQINVVELIGGDNNSIRRSMRGKKPINLIFPCGACSFLFA